MPTWKNQWYMNKFAVLALYIAVAFSVYGAFLDNPMLMDDEIQITGNQQIQDLSNWRNYFTSSTMDTGGASGGMGGIYYKPLMTSYFAIVWHFFQGEPMAYRIPAVALHACSAFLIFLFSLLFLPPLMSVCCGLLFLLHPLTVEPALYLADVQDVFYMFFGLLALLFTVYAPAKLWTYFVLAILFVLALLSKETGAVFVGLSFIYAYLYRREKALGTFIVAAIVALTYFYVRYRIGLTETRSGDLLFHDASFLTRLSMLPLILAHYVELLIVPIRLSIATDFVITTLTFENFGLPCLILIIAGTTVFFVWRALRKRSEEPIIAFFVAVFVLWFMLHGNLFLPVDGVYSDRWAYLLTWVFISMCLLAFDRLKPKTWSWRPGAAIVTVILILFIARDVVRARDFQEPLEFFRREAQLHPWDAVMTNNVGVELFRRGRWQAARPYFEQATLKNPKWAVAWSNLGVTYEREQNFSKALECYEKSLSLSAYYLAVENYGKLLCALDRKEDCRKHVEIYLRFFPRNEALKTIKTQYGF